jgi:hypothetical protein
MQFIRNFILSNDNHSQKKPKFTRKELIPYVCRSSSGIKPRIYAKASSENSSFSSDVKAPAGDV